MAILEVRNLCYEIGTKKILKNVSFKLEEGESLGVVGPNGSGKSTLLKCIYRVNRGYGGDIYLQGREITGLPVQETARTLAVVPQNSELAFDFSVLEMVLMGRSPYKKFMEQDHQQDYELARQAIAQVGLADFADRALTTMSGGERQRALLARALCQQAKIMVLDEPTNHLDIRYQLEVMEILRGMNYTMLTAIHELNLCYLYCDRIVALKAGELIAEGDPRKILTPELIRELYGVEASVLEDPQTGTKSICYLPQGK